MTIERILICVLFLLMVRAEINFVRLARKHNGLTAAMGMMTDILSQHINGLGDELVDKMKKHDPEYKEYIEKEEDEQDD